MKTTLPKIFFLLTFLLAGQLFSQSLGYNNHRIAISADGNNQPDNHPEAEWPRADPDDWGGTPAALAMIAKLELKHRLVHYSYNNFIDAPKHTDQTNYMGDGVNGAIQRWDFDSTVFFDVPENPSVAINHLAGEIEKSTADDPLYFIHMGPSEFFYLAVNKAIANGKIEALAHVQVISHSGYNDNHLRRTAHHSMQQTIDLSGGRIKYKKISDQNACDSPAIKWCSNTDFSPYYWMRDHADQNIQWLYSRLQFHPGGKGADISDAGMVYYLILGDEEGNPSKLETLIGDGIANSTNTTGCVDFNFNGVQDFEMSKIGNYEIAYKDTSRNAIAVDASLYEDKFGATQKVFEGPTGVYDVTLTTLTEEDGESTYRFRIDNQLIGSFQNPVATTDMEPYTHVFRNVTLTQGAVFQIESNTHSNGTVPEGNGFAWARGRWRSIDFQCLNVAAQTCILEDKDGLFVFEAERFTLNGNWKLGTDNEKASGGKYIYYDGPNSYATVNHQNDISYSFNIKTPGTYTFKWTMRQPEGERGSDLGNDAWFYFSNDIAKAGADVLTEFYKFVGRSDDDFTLNGASDINHKQSWVNVTFPSAGEYTLNLSGRSHGFQLDRVVLYNSRQFDAVPAEIAQISETLACTAGGGPLVDPTSITLTPNPLVIQVGTSRKLTTKMQPFNANPEVTWSSADTSIATVDDQGNVTGVKLGTTTVTAKSTADNSILGTANIDILETLYQPSIKFDDANKYTTTTYYSEGELVVNVEFHAGSGNTVLSNGDQGIKYWLRHLDKGWVLKNDYLGNDASVIGMESGTSTATISLKDAIPTADLEDGDFYWLWVNFLTSDGNKQIEAQLTNIQILDAQLKNTNLNLQDNLGVYPNPAKDILHFNGNFNNQEAIIYDIYGAVVLKMAIDGSNQSLKVDNLSSGLYFLHIGNSITKFMKE
ncbi:Ig-like domain-containing protein [Tamlana sp. 2_MG-2023]|uniref:T9SS type A sorting domain-containing protein n=1 Tax=unclassified Tamlana TaxID=2614803 RepID=UPI0026E38A4B|nr:MULTISPECIES: Ig-like domain-containing protein [unclassified Tamlana]MDO6760820.1 Ig-like domain-containing protein [Tamlana sp. 2_MG-2023]MDO6791076.1 Ig-like domain-containing protein [Tamlana sp. 1_MG-2023]